MTFAFTSFQGGRYQVLQKLGEGGKGIVFICQDEVLGRKVAIKLLKEEVLDSEGLLRFQREVQATARLVHPQVVTVFDTGQESGRHYLVLELMEGGDLEHVITSSPQKRLDAATAVRLSKDVARALEDAHSHGILHRDVKPGNIWLTKDGHAKLGDFGLAYLRGGPRVTRAGMLVGSVAYLPPEVALGRQADARSDLYMLGVTLYEMVTGRVPFLGDDPVRVLFSHINDLPPAPRRFTPDIPPRLEALILRLLSKDPEQRPSSSSEFLRLLEEVERELHIVPTPAGALEAPLASAPRIPTPEQQAVQPLVGREREVTFLRQRIDAALRGEGSLVLLTGEAGVGKTRLALEVRGYARGRSFLWLEGHYTKEASIPSQPWVEAIRAFLRIAPPAFLDKTLLPFGWELVKLVPELAERLGRAPAVPELGPEEERARRLEAVAGFFFGLARQQPLVLFLDDLQWALALDTLHHLARSVAAERILVVGAYRDVELEEKPTLAKTLLAMNRERLFHSLPLKRLDEGEVAKMLAQTLGESASAKLAELVYQKTEGNPFFVEELARYLIDSGVITLGDRGWDVQKPALVQLPRSVKAVVGERLEQLAEEARTVLAWAAVAGPEFSLPLLKEITELEEDKLLEAVDKAFEKRVLTAHPALGQEVYAFADHQTRDVLYEGIGPARRRRFHLKVAQAIEKVHARRLEEHYEALAHHFLEGNDLPKALEYALKAGDRAYVLSTWERASYHYELALELLGELPEDSSRQAEVLNRLAELESLLGRQGLRHTHAALNLYTKLREKRLAARMHCLIGSGWFSGLAGGSNKEKGVYHFAEAVKLLEGEPDSAEKAASLSWFAFGQIFGSVNHEQALHYAKHSLEIAERLNDPDQVAKACADVSAVLFYQGELTQAREYAERSWEVALQGKDPWMKARNAIWPIAVVPWSNDRAWMQRWLQYYSEYRQRSRLERYDRAFWGLNALFAVLSGKSQEAAEALRHGEEFASLHPYLHPWWDYFTGAAHALLGDEEQASRLLVDALEACENSKINANFVEASTYYSRFLLGSGDTTRGEAVLSRAYALADEKGSVLQQLNLLPLLCELHVRIGRLDEAQHYLEKAQELLARPQPWRGLAAGIYMAEGILATAEENWPEAEKAFGKAREVERLYGFPYGEARVLAEWGKMHLKRDAAGDRDRGMEMLDQALVIFGSCAAKKDVEKVLAQKRVLEA